jgi:DNA invertase Pin-like site-specific DNA recombinase
VLQEILLRESAPPGGALLSATPGENELLRDPDDPTRKLMRQMLGAFAEYEKAIIALRLAAGRAAKRASGGKGLAATRSAGRRRGRSSASRLSSL